MAPLIYRAFEELLANPRVLTIGNFDGVHRGHQHLLGWVHQRSTKHGARSLVVTFDPLPAEVLRPGSAPLRLCTIDQRIALIGACQIDDVLVLRFDDQLANQTPESFLERLRACAAPVEIVVGHDFRFGRERSGSVEMLRHWCQLLGFGLTVVPRLDLPSGAVSSTRIRALLADGAVEAAAELLGRPYVLVGDVVAGQQRGQLLGYPTANLRLIDRLALPADGIYAVLVSVDGSLHLQPGMLYIGTRPVFGQEARAIEVHLLDVRQDLYDRRLTVLLVRRLRDDRWFPSIDALIEQMQADERSTRDVLAHLPGDWPPPLARVMLSAVEGAVSTDG